MTGTEETRDIVVVGAGGCGMVAALRAAADGAQVLILEKTGAPGGGTALASRSIRAANSRVQREAGVQDDPDLWADDIVRRNNGTGDLELTRTLTRVSGQMADFVEDSTAVQFELGRFIFGHNAQRSHSWSEDRTITDYLYDAVRVHPSIEVRFDTDVTSLIQAEDGAILGVTTGDHRMLARKTILAAGGFSADPERIAQYIPIAVGIPSPGHPGTDGAVMALAVTAGAELRNMDSFHPYPAFVLPSGRMVSPEVIFSGGVMVTREGRRFINEMRYPGPLSTAMLSLQGKGAWEIFDEEIFDHHADTKFGGLRALAAEGILKTADEPGALAARLGIDADGLRATLDEYAAASGGTDTFGREIKRPFAAPLYGIAVNVALFQTLGGVRVSSEAEVLRADGTPIPNLYAGGGMASGISGPGSEGYMPGNGLIASLGMGFIAGRAAARPSSA